MRILLSFVAPVLFAVLLVALAVNFLEFWQQDTSMPASATYQANMHGGRAASSYWSGRM